VNLHVDVIVPNNVATRSSLVYFVSYIMVFSVLVILVYTLCARSLESIQTVDMNVRVSTLCSVHSRVVVCSDLELVLFVLQAASVVSVRVCIEEFTYPNSV
jgi:membrane-anchored glycerophosphoryl diester phosphodiesterase (GDPDase)